MAVNNKKLRTIKVISTYSILVLLIIVLMYVSIKFGNGNSINFGHLFLDSSSQENIKLSTDCINLLKMRWPRTLIAFFTGACLSLAGVMFQNVTRSKLVDSAVIGVSSSTFILHLSLSALITNRIVLIFSPIFATIFGSLVLGLILYLSWQRGIRSERLILVGVSFNLLMIVLSIFIALSSGLGATSILYKIVGRIDIIPELEGVATIIFSVIGIILSLLVIPKCNILALGDNLASDLGLNVTKFKIILLILGVYLSSVATQYLGMTAFIGLLAPLLARKFLGSNHVHVIPLSALIGGLTVLIFEFVGRMVSSYTPVQIPVGITLTVIGGIIYLIMLKRTYKNGY